MGITWLLIRLHFKAACLTARPLWTTDGVLYYTESRLGQLTRSQSRVDTGHNRGCQKHEVSIHIHPWHSACSGQDRQTIESHSESGKEIESDVIAVNFGSN